MLLIPCFFDILACVSLVHSKPTTHNLSPRNSLMPDPIINCCRDNNVNGWGAADYLSILKGAPEKGPFTIDAGPGKCKNLYTTPISDENKRKGIDQPLKNELWICNDLPTKTEFPDLFTTIAISQLKTKCPVDGVGGHLFCGQAFWNYQGDLWGSPVKYNFNVICNGTNPGV